MPRRPAAAAGRGPASSRRAARLGLLLVLCLQLAMGSAYARQTPIWQAPDEPAHYNYVAQILATGRLPVIEPADDPHARLEALKAAGFPAGSSIEGIDYEDHQPPAYYLLALPFYALATPDPASRVPLIRMAGLLLACLTTSLAWIAARILAPEEPWLALGAAGFTAFLPMHLAMAAAVNNDGLSFALAAAVTVLGLARVGGAIDRRRGLRRGGLLLGLAVWTKVTLLLPALAVLVGAELLAPDRPRRPADRIRDLLALALRALLVASPWLLRNAWIHGPLDPLGLRAHALAVACRPDKGCQPRSADWIAEQGLADLLQRMLEMTFASFWGVFGWMGVFMGRLAGIPIYGALALLSLLVALALARSLPRLARGRRRRDQLRLLGLSLAATTGGFLLYNLSYVQHQGRYLLPALLPIALLFGLGLSELGAAGGRALGLGRQRARRWGARLPAAFAAALLGLAWIALQRYIVPGLG